MLHMKINNGRLDNVDKAVVTMNSRLGAAIKRFLGDPAGELEEGKEVPEQMQNFLRLGKMEDAVTPGVTNAATSPWI